MIDWDSLRVVLAIHRGGSMAAAADALGIDRATVLRRLDALEARLKSRLFQRRSDGCVLSPAGRNIIGLVEGVEQAMTALAHRAESEDGAAEGLVTVAAPEFLVTSVLAPAVTTLASLHPGLTLDFRCDFSAVDLARGEADIALRFVRPAREAIVARRVGSLAVALYASQKYLDEAGTPLDGKYEGHRFLLIEGPLGQIPAMGWLLAQMQGAHTAMRSTEVAPLVASAKAGAGIACVPVLAASEIGDLVLVPPGVIGRCDMYLATHRDLRSRARVRSAYDFIVRILGHHAAGLSGGDIIAA
jgi:DNA-binding transcriptional LysR family regulator